MSLAELFAFLPEDIQKEALANLGQDYCNALEYNWNFFARKKQVAPLNQNWWTTWLILAGRGWGKSRTGAETVKQVVEKEGAIRIALVAKTPADARDVMIEGESGLLNIFPEYKKPNYQPSKRRVTFHNGAIATVYSSNAPNQLRGPQHHFGWADEVASWKYPQETWDNLMLGLRLGKNPRAVATTTPRPIQLIKDLIDEEATFLTKGNTFENTANLSKAFFNRVINKYEGTRLGQQELYAKLLSDNPNALWDRDVLKEKRLKRSEAPDIDDLERIVVSIDPATTSNEKSDETGITVGGIDKYNRGYLIEDLSCKKSPNKWAEVAVEAYHDYKADRIIAEANNGGDLVESVIKTVDSSVAYKKINASRGKHTRAEPVAALYEQGKIYHVGFFGKLEDQYCNWIPGEESPDRLDSAVWLFTDLLLNNKGYKKVKPSGIGRSSTWKK